jgi:hypothetical protein
MSRCIAVVIASVMLFPCTAQAVTTNEKILAHISAMRNVTVKLPSGSDYADTNAKLDQAWKFLLEHERDSTPILVAALDEELGKKEADQFFLLDAAYLLLQIDEKSFARLARRTLLRIDPSMPVISANMEQFLRFAHQLSYVDGKMSREDLSRLFLAMRTPVSFFRPPHVVNLDAVLMYVFVLGVSDVDTAAFVGRQLETIPDPLSRSLAITALRYLGSDEIVPALIRLLNDEKDERVVVSALNTLLHVGGTTGAAFVAKFDWSRLISTDVQLIQHLRGMAATRNCSTIRRELEKLGPRLPLSKVEIKTRLEKMLANKGVDIETTPVTIFDADIPTETLSAQLKQIRRETLRRLDNHAIDDVRTTTQLINGLQIRQANPLACQP